MSCSSCRRRCSAVPFLHTVPSIPFRSAPLRPRRRRPGAPGRRDLFARVSCVRAPARAGASCAGAVRAPDCAREAKGAGLPPVPAGAFFAAPAIASLCRKAERRPREPPSLPPFYYTFSPVKPSGGRNMKFFLFRRKTDQQGLDSTGLLEAPSKPGRATCSQTLQKQLPCNTSGSGLRLIENTARFPLCVTPAGAKRRAGVQAAEVFAGLRRSCWAPARGPGRR